MIQESKSKMILASGNLEKIGLSKLKETELLHYFEEPYGAFGDFALDRQRVVYEALLLAGWADEKDKADSQKCESCFLIGDTVKDIAAARAANIRAIGVTTGGDGHKELRAAGAEAVFMRFDRAVEYILDQAWWKGVSTGLISP